MTDTPRDYEQQLAEIMDTLAESTLEMTDEEIRLELKDEGLDPDVVVMEVRKLLNNTLKSYQQRLLLEAEQRYKESVSAITDQTSDLPESADAQREIINSILATNPQLGRGFLTAQARDFDSLPDEDLRAFVSQLLNLIKHNDLLIGDAKE